MSLTSSLFSGVSGLASMGNSMTVIGDNIANVNTIGFKSSRVTFQDVLSQTVATNSGSAQVGRGTGIGAISGMFVQGSFESTESPTDLAIGGDGFFILRDPNNVANNYYSRAGEFRFDKDGFFTNPAGYIVQGWELRRDDSSMDVEDIGSITDIQLESFTSPPEATDSVSLMTNLDSRATDNTTGAGLPLSGVWDGDTTLPVNLADVAYEYQTTVKVYDSLGSTHDITVYYDRGELANTYEYIVTCNPSEDRRDIFTGDNDAGLGLLGRGLLSFTAQGVLASQTFERFVGNSGGNISSVPGTGPWAAAGPGVGGAWTGDPANLVGGPPPTETYTFTSASAGTIGTNTITMNWASTNGGDAGTITIPADYVLGDYVQGPDGMNFSFDSGDVVAVGNAYTVTVGQGDSDVLADPNNWSDMTGDYTEQHYTFAADFLGGPAGTTNMDIQLDMGAEFDGTNWSPNALSTTQFATGSTTVYQTSSGYGAGSLQNISVDIDGVITGQYSNGQVTPLFRVALGDFQNTQGLFKEGGNMFSETRTSGPVITNKPGTNGLGSIAPNSLEQSNVDMAAEFVRMITTERAYQANSKIVTTVDGMLGDTIAMKR
ncbi:MAG: flagellar hook-basal body complex protein [Desulfobacteraceae bacterium]|jgi:flagellar hook protein FlgE